MRTIEVTYEQKGMAPMNLVVYIVSVPCARNGTGLSSVVSHKTIKGHLKPEECLGAG
jgi:hypothetical protein